MSAVYAYDVLFFFGAGASAPFGIPTMKQFVIDFEDLLSRKATDDERITYSNIKASLEKQLGKPVDLEAIFSVIEGVINYNPERLGFLALYCCSELKKPTENTVEVCKTLKKRFQEFVREKCAIPEHSFEKIGMVYHDFFNRFALELPAANTGERKPPYAWNNRWTLFTTNYDVCLEYYWHEVAVARIDTGFRFDADRNATFLDYSKLLHENIGMQLFKLHGSVDWFVDAKTNEVMEVEMERGRSHIGRKSKGEMMVYPISEKELYLDPYISMLLRLNRELQRKSVWVVIGYSFNDPIVREIFLRKSSAEKHLVFVHPQASQICQDRLQGAQLKLSLLEKKFGEDEFRQVNHQIMHKLIANPSGWTETPFP